MKKSPPKAFHLVEKDFMESVFSCHVPIAQKPGCSAERGTITPWGWCVGQESWLLAVNLSFAISVLLTLWFKQNLFPNQVMY